MLGTGEDLRWLGADVIRRVNLWEEVLPLKEWAEKFCDRIRSAPDEGDKPILVGYSMGGRLALHALLEDPNCWKAAVIISSHPGLSDDEERAKRLANDLRWSEAARELPWSEFLNRWNAQPVFDGSDTVDRSDLVTHRESIAKAFDVWSLGRQEALGERIAEIGCPILWITGEKDRKFSALAEQLPLRHELAPRCGHRVLADNPEWLEERIGRFVAVGSASALGPAGGDT